MITEKKLTKIYVVRHGESIHNINESNHDENFHDQWGESQAPLTKKGAEQAQQRAKTLQNIQFDAVFSSDLTRAKQTAEIITLEKKLAINTTKLIRERNHWQYLYHMAKLGKSVKEVEEETREILSKLDENAKMSYKLNEQIESPSEAAGRLLTFLREIAVSYPGKTILVINHGNNMRSLLTHLGWAKFDELPSVKSIENTGYFVLESDGVDFYVIETYGIHKFENAVRIF